MQSRFVDLKEWIQLKITGLDTLTYLNGIITKDLNQLKDGEIARSAFLTPKGHIRSIYWIKKQDDAIFLYCPDEMKQKLVEDLLKYKLSMDVKLEDITDEVPALYLIETKKRIPGLYLGQSGFTFVNSNTIPEGMKISYSEFQSLLVEHGVVPPEVMSGQNPFEIGIQDAISLEKGCFLGQEPISRMYHRGNPRKYVYKITGPSLGVGAPILNSEEEVGKVIIVSEKTALAYIRRKVKNFDTLESNNSKIEVIERVGEYPSNER